MAILAHVRDSVLGLSPADRAGSRVQSKRTSVFRWENNFRGPVRMGLSSLFECQSRSIDGPCASCHRRTRRNFHLRLAGGREPPLVTNENFFSRFRGSWRSCHQCSGTSIQTKSFGPSLQGLSNVFPSKNLGTFLTGTMRYNNEVLYVCTPPCASSLA